ALVAGNTATVTLSVTSVNDAPVATGGSYTTNEDTPTTQPAATDIDTPLASLTYSVVSAPKRGSLAFNSNGTFTYSPALNYNGPDSFSFRANDGQLNSNT